MATWKAPWRVLREDAAPSIEFDPDPPEARGDDEVVTGLKLDDGLHTTISLHDLRPTELLERTQCLREQRERERASVPPVYDFGSEPSWQGGDW